MSSDLNEPVWAVIGQSYLNYGLTHAQAVAEAKDLVARGQHAWIVTNEAAKRLVETSASGVSLNMSTELRF